MARLAPVRQFGTHARKAVIGFVRDLTDNSAETVWTPNWAADSLRTLGIAVLAASGQIEAVQKLVSQLVGDFSSAIQILLLLCAILWCVAVISSKIPSTRVSLIVGDLRPMDGRGLYGYSQPLRFVAKLGLLLFVIALPFRVRIVVDKLLPLPETIYGYVFLGADKPVNGARIRVISSNGADITSGTWTTDSRGFYILKGVRRLRRSDLVKVQPDGCKKELTLALSKSNEVSAGTAKDQPDGTGIFPIFIHHLDCGKGNDEE